jgi:S1-C subfamily serine protease
MNPVRPLAAAALLSTVLAVPGCIVVIDRDHETRYTEGDRSARAQLGITTERPEAATAAQLNLDRDRATTITYVYPGSPAERAGLRRYDIITGLDANDCVSPAKLREIVRTHRKGDALKVSYLREGKPAETTVTLD